MRSLAGLNGLRRLDLKGCRFVADDFRFLCEQWANGSCPKLKEIWLEGATISDEDLRALGKVERISWLILSKTPISDQGLSYLHGLKKLETLWLMQTQVSENGILGLAGLPHLSIVALDDSPTSEQTRERLFRAQIAAQKSKKPVNQAQLQGADERLRAFLGEMEDWEHAAYQRAKEIEERYRAQRPMPNQLGTEESRANKDFWRDLNVQKAAIAARFCSQKLLARGAGRAGAYGNPPCFSRVENWIDFETPSAQKTIFYGDGCSGLNNKRRYTLIWEEGAWKLEDVQWWSGGWKRDIV